jgi:hypothetical protein
VVASGPSAPSALTGLMQPGSRLAGSMLAATADRERAADVLRAGLAEGRLSQEEFEERLAQVYASRTYGELDELTGDLPTAAFLPDLTNVPAAGPADRDRQGASLAGLVLTAAAVFTLAALVTAIAVYLHSRSGAPALPPSMPGIVHLLPAIKPAHPAAMTGIPKP